MGLIYKLPILDNVQHLINITNIGLGVKYGLVQI